jgi:hypothetical protein
MTVGKKVKKNERKSAGMQATSIVSILGLLRTGHQKKKEAKEH